MPLFSRKSKFVSLDIEKAVRTNYKPGDYVTDKTGRTLLVKDYLWIRDQYGPTAPFGVMIVQPNGKGSILVRPENVRPSTDTEILLAKLTI